jgi:hypothetical protein
MIGDANNTAPTAFANQRPSRFAEHSRKMSPSDPEFSLAKRTIGPAKALG